MAFKITTSVTPITDLKTRSREIVKALKETGRPILITQRGRVTAVMESAESFERRQQRYEQIEGVLSALREAENGDLHDHKEALKILETF